MLAGNRRKLTAKAEYQATVAQPLTAPQIAEIVRAAKEQAAQPPKEGRAPLLALWRIARIACAIALGGRVLIYDWSVAKELANAALVLGASCAAISITACALAQRREHGWWNLYLVTEAAAGVALVGAIHLMTLVSATILANTTNEISREFVWMWWGFLMLLSVGLYALFGEMWRDGTVIEWVKTESARQLAQQQAQTITNPARSEWANSRRSYFGDVNLDG